MPTFKTTDAVFDARTFDFTALYQRGFNAFDTGTTSNYEVVGYSHINGATTIEQYDRTVVHSDGTQTVAHVEHDRGGGFGFIYDTTQLTSISEYYGDQLLYTLTDD